jgi:hypothetical protein
MTSVVSEALDWLKGSKYGYKFKDKILLFLYILNATFHRNPLLNWIPFKSVVIEREVDYTWSINDSIKSKGNA